MSLVPNKLSRRFALRAGLAAAAGAGVFATVAGANTGESEEGTLRCAVYIPRFDLDDDVVERDFGISLGIALGAMAAKKLVKKLKKRNRGAAFASNFAVEDRDPLSDLVGHITPIRLAQGLVDRIGPCMLLSYPKTDDDGLEALEDDANSRGLTTATLQKSGCIFVDLELREDEVDESDRGIWNKVKKGLKEVSKVAVKAAREHGKSALKAVGKEVLNATPLGVLTRGFDFDVNTRGAFGTKCVVAHRATSVIW